MSNFFRRVALGAILLGLGAGVSQAAELEVPAHTAYFQPNPRAASISEKEGITGWNDPATQVLWFGRLAAAGELHVALRVRPPRDSASRLRLTVGDQAQVVELPANPNGSSQTVALGTYSIDAAGYQRFTLESLNSAAGPCGDIEALILSGPASEGAHFNLKPRRNSASIHLSFPTPRNAEIASFYNEVTALEDPLQTFYMACGFHRGYLGMQVISPTERRIIFSIWDSGSGAGANQRSEVDPQNYVTLVAKGEDVHTSVFGGEGTGGHSHLKYLWKTGEPQRFLLTAALEEAGKAVYSGYYFHPEQQRWRLIASFRVPNRGEYLKGLYSFSENFSGETGHLLRKARFGNQWVRTSDGQWIELTEARFSHDPTGRADRLDRAMGLEQNQFFLSHGGFLPDSTPFGKPFHREPNRTPPEIDLPTAD